jgi:hypothetical protein
LMKLELAVASDIDDPSTALARPQCAPRGPSEAARDTCRLADTNSGGVLHTCHQEHRMTERERQRTRGGSCIIYFVFCFCILIMLDRFVFCFLFLFSCSVVLYCVLLVFFIYHL